MSEVKPEHEVKPSLTEAEETEDLIANALSMLDAAPPETSEPEEGADPVNQVPSISSPTLDQLDKTRRPEPATICEGCPNSVWFSSPTEVKCYCRVMYLVTWSSEEPNRITGCDGIHLGQE